MLVPVLNLDGHPLSPCHPARARKLLKEKKATPVSTYPFVIRLTNQVENPILPIVRVIFDDGKTCGLSVVEETSIVNKVLCTVEVMTRGEEICDNLKGRRALRNSRRNRHNKKRHREGQIKIAFRHGQEYPPSIRADAEAKVNVIKKLQKLYPISEIVLEPVKIDIVKKIRPDVASKKCRNGSTEGMNGSVNQKRRLAILKRDGKKCLYCGDAVTSETACIHHFVQRKHGGSKRYDIAGTLCERCHTSVATDDLAMAFDITHYPSIRAAGRAMHGRFLLEKMLGEPGTPVSIKYGYETKALREGFGLEKSHRNDATALGCNPDKPIMNESTSYQIKLHSRHGGRRLFDANPGVAAYRGQAKKQDHVDQSRMKVDEHDLETNKKNRSYRRHIYNKYYKKLHAEGNFNEDLLPGKKHLNEAFTVNRAILLLKSDSVLVKNQRIEKWKYTGEWPSRWSILERYDLVRTNKGDVGIVTALNSNKTARVDFVEKHEDRKVNHSFYKPENLTILQKRSSQTWIQQNTRLSSSP